MPPVVNPNPYLTSNWPDKSKVIVEKRFQDPGVRGAGVGSGGGSMRVNMVTNNVTTTFTLESKKYYVEELVFSGTYGLMPVGVGTNEYVIKRLWSPVLHDATSPSTTLPKVFYCTSDINASLGTGWKWYLQSRSPYSAISRATMEAWYSGSGLIISAGPRDDKDEELDTNPNKQGYIEVPGVGTIYVEHYHRLTPMR